MNSCSRSRALRDLRTTTLCYCAVELNMLLFLFRVPPRDDVLIHPRGCTLVSFAAATRADQDIVDVASDLADEISCRRGRPHAFREMTFIRCIAFATC